MNSKFVKVPVLFKREDFDEQFDNEIATINLNDISSFHSGVNGITKVYLNNENDPYSIDIPIADFEAVFERKIGAAEDLFHLQNKNGDIEDMLKGL